MDIAQHQMITIGLPTSEEFLGFETWLALGGSERAWQPGIVTDQPTTLIALVRAGLGIGLINLLAARAAGTSGLAMRELIGPHNYRDVGLFWDADRPTRPAVQALIDEILRTPVPAGTIPLVSSGAGVDE